MVRLDDARGTLVGLAVAPTRLCNRLPREWLVIGPWGSLRIALRKHPWGIAGQSRKLRATDSAPITHFQGSGPNSRLLSLPGNQALELELREWHVELERLPNALAGLRILQISDLHFSHAYNQAYFDWVIDHSLDRPADLVVVTGDVVEEDGAVDWIEPVLGRLHGKLGQYAILGNHDYMHDPELVARILSDSGFQVLEGRWDRLEQAGISLAIGGTSAPWGPCFAGDEIPQADFRLLLSHAPDLFPRAAGWGIDLMLSGHNHGGQIRFPLVGPIFMPSRYSRRFDRGFFRSRGTLLYVSEGVGGKHPARYGCPPEIAWFTLQTARHPGTGSFA